MLRVVLRADGQRPILPIDNAEAKAEAEMKEYVEKIEHTDAKIEMVPIKGGEFLMGSPDREEGRAESRRAAAPGQGSRLLDGQVRDPLGCV